MTYSDKAVIKAAHSVNLISYRVDMTDFDEKQKMTLEQYGGTALPYAVLFDKDGNITHRFTGMFSVNTLIEAIYGTPLFN